MERTYNVHKLVSDYPGFRQPCDALGLTGTDGLRAVISESDIKQRLVALLGVAFLTFTSREAKAQAVRVRRAALRVVHLGEPRPAPPRSPTSPSRCTPAGPKCSGGRSWEPSTWRTS